MKRFLSLVGVLVCCSPVFAASFVAVDPDTSQVASIVVQDSEGSGTEKDWARVVARERARGLRNVSPLVGGRPFNLGAVDYLREAVLKMTGKELPVVAGNDLSRGIVLVTLDHAPEELRDDPEVQAALGNTGQDPYSHQEAYFIRTEPDRVLIVANTEPGLVTGIVALLESVGYEVLGMGPRWIHVPDYRERPLVFSHNASDRPGFYLRRLSATAGQPYGVGTINYGVPLSDPADEPVNTSYDRWLLGTRMATQSMPPFGGHSIQRFHQQILNTMREQGTTEGFLLEAKHLGPEAERPAASPENARQVWINTDGKGEAFLSNGEEWVKQTSALRASADLSVPYVRRMILEDLKQRAGEHFDTKPNEVFIFGTDPEDGGGYDKFDRTLRYKNWYPEYLAAEGVKFGQSYVLHGMKGLDQPVEIWDPAAPGDTVFGFNNWLLREFDKWIDSLPEDQRVTATGKPKKDLVRCSLLSYNYHDVPPNFNLDPRIRVMIADYPKNRKRGKWKEFRTHADLAEAFSRLLPEEPPADYEIYSLAFFRDHQLERISGSPSAAAIHADMHRQYDAGFRGVAAEMDFNFGKLGLEYYLRSKMLWNPQMSAAELEKMRDRWLQRAFGGGWREMKEYYDFMTPEQFTFSTPRYWAKAVRLIDAGDKRIDPEKEPGAQRRIDDIKQWWYFYYLIDSGQTSPSSEALREFIWKGQMAYMTAMRVPINRFIGRKLKVKDVVAPKLMAGPAHYTHEEVRSWWPKILERWPEMDVTDFSDATLADGTKGRDVDLRDLVRVAEFRLPGNDAENSLLYNRREIDFLTTAEKEGEEIGFKLFWPAKDHRHYRISEVAYGISYWDAEQRKWEELVDMAMTAQPVEVMEFPDGESFRVAEVRFSAPQPGTYQVLVGRGGNLARLTSLDWEPASGNPAEGAAGQTYFSTITALSQSGSWFYIPRGTTTLDLEMWKPAAKGTVHMHQGLPSTGMRRTRSVDIGTLGTHRIDLKPGEDGSLVMLDGGNLFFPYLYSVPFLWAQSPSALLVPRAVAKADGLTSE